MRGNQLDLLRRQVGIPDLLDEGGKAQRRIWETGFYQCGKRLPLSGQAGGPLGVRPLAEALRQYATEISPT